MKCTGERATSNTQNKFSRSYKYYYVYILSRYQSRDLSFDSFQIAENYANRVFAIIDTRDRKRCRGNISDKSISSYGIRLREKCAMCAGQGI